MSNAPFDNHRDTWTKAEERALRNLYGFMPLSKIAEDLGRTPDAVNRRRIQLQIPAVRDRRDVMLIGEFADAMGINRQAARRVARMSRFSHTMYEGDRKVTAVMVDELLSWLKNPLNWKHFDANKVQHPVLRDVIEAARGDEWLTMSEAADRAGYSYWGIYKLVRNRRLPARKGSRGMKGNEVWLIRASDMDSFLRKHYGRGAENLRVHYAQ